MIEISTYVLGPLENNVYLLADPDSGSAVLVDPALGSETVLERLERRGLALQEIWITHAHFDHVAGLNAVLKAAGNQVPVLLHPQDKPLWFIPAWAGELCIPRQELPAPRLEFRHGLVMKIGSEQVEVRHAPGHSPGHVLFHLPESSVLICGDVIFRHGIGRTDLQGGDYQTLIRSIESQVLTLPAGTRLLPGHGPESTVGEEQAANPFLAS